MCEYKQPNELRQSIARDNWLLRFCMPRVSKYYFQSGSLSLYFQAETLELSHCVHLEHCAMSFPTSTHPSYVRFANAIVCTEWILRSPLSSALVFVSVQSLRHCTYTLPFLMPNDDSWHLNGIIIISTFNITMNVWYQNMITHCSNKPHEIPVFCSTIQISRCSLFCFVFSLHFFVLMKMTYICCNISVVYQLICTGKCVKRSDSFC